MVLPLLRGEPSRSIPRVKDPGILRLSFLAFHDIERMPSFPMAAHYRLLEHQPDFISMCGITADLPQAAAHATFQEFAEEQSYYWAAALELFEERQAIGTFHVFFSKFPLKAVKVIPIPPEFDRTSSANHSIRGGRCALTTEILCDQRTFHFCTTRLEDKTGPAGRARQMTAIMEQWADPGDPGAIYMVMGGLNSILVDGSEPDAHPSFVEHIAETEPKAFLNPITREPLFAVCAQRGFSWDAFNEPFQPTYHHPGIARDTNIDWMIGKNLAHQVTKVDCPNLFTESERDEVAVGHTQMLELNCCS